MYLKPHLTQLNPHFTHHSTTNLLKKHITQNTGKHHVKPQTHEKLAEPAPETLPEPHLHGIGVVVAPGLGGPEVRGDGGDVEAEGWAEDHSEAGLVGLGGLRGVAEGGEEEGAGLLGVPLEGLVGDHLEGVQGGHAPEEVDDEELAGGAPAARVESTLADGPAHVVEGGVRVVVLEVGPGAQVEERHPEAGVAEDVLVGVELVGEVPVDVVGVEEGLPEGPPVHVLEAQDDGFEAQRAEVARVHRVMVPDRHQHLREHGQGHFAGKCWVGA